MLSLQFFLAIIAASAAGVNGNSLARRQFTGIPVFGALETLEPESVVTLTSNITDAIRERVRWGPFTLKASVKKDNATLAEEGDTFEHLLGGICRDCMVLHGSATVTYEDGSPADIETGVYNHHIVFADLGREPKSFYDCRDGGSPTATGGVITNISTSNPMEAAGHDAHKRDEGHETEATASATPSGTPKIAVQIFGSGDDGSAFDFLEKTGKLKSGFYISPTDQVTHSSRIVNYKEEKQVVYLTAEYEYVQGQGEYRDAFSSIASVTGCASGSQGFIPPANITSVITSPNLTVTTPGAIYNSMAHLHDGGTKVRLYVNQKLECESQAIYGGGDGSTVINGQTWETIQGYTRCDQIIPVKVGDVLTVDSEYDLPNHPLRPGSMDNSMGTDAMGIMVFIFAEERTDLADNASDIETQTSDAVKGIKGLGGMAVVVPVVVLLYELAFGW